MVEMEFSMMKFRKANYPWADVMLWIELDNSLYKIGQIILHRNFHVSGSSGVLSLIFWT